VIRPDLPGEINIKIYNTNGITIYNTSEMGNSDKEIVHGFDLTRLPMRINFYEVSNGYAIFTRNMIKQS